MKTQPRIAARDLRFLVTLQEPDKQTVGQGQRDYNYKTVAQVWANIEPVSSKEFYAAQQTQHTLTHRVTMRPRADIQSDWRILYEGMVLNVSGPARNIGLRDRLMEVTCTEVRP